MRVAGGLETRLLSVARWAPALRFGSVPYLRKSAGRNFLLPLKDILNNFCGSQLHQFVAHIFRGGGPSV